MKKQKSKFLAAAGLVLALAPAAQAATIFAADFQGTGVVAQDPITKAVIDFGTQNGDWTIGSAPGQSRLDADGTNFGALFDNDGLDITAEFSAAGTLASGVTISYKTMVRRTGDPAKTSMIKGLASDDTVLFVLGLQGFNGTGNGEEQLAYFSADFTGDTDGTNNPTINYVGTAGDFGNDNSAYSADKMEDITLELSATSFDILIGGVLASGGDDVSYLSAATDIDRLVFQSDADGGAWYDNFDVQAVPEPSTFFLAALGMLLGFSGFRRRRTA
jgi:hypothetical protein